MLGVIVCTVSFVESVWCVIMSTDVTFRCVLTMLETAYNILLREAESDVRCNLVTSKNCDDEKLVYTFDVSQAETICIFCICVIAEIGNAKNNIIGVSRSV